MRALIVLFYTLFSGHLLADASVSSDAGTKVETTKESTYSHDKQINVDKTKTNAQSIGQESVQSTAAVSRELLTYGFDRRIQVSRILVPMVQAIERGELDGFLNYEFNETYRAIRNCGILTYPTPVASSLFITHPIGIQTSWGSRNSSGFRTLHEAGPGYPSLETVKGGQVYHYSSDMESKNVRFASPSEGVKCVVLYGELFSQVINNLSAKGVKTRNGVQLDGSSVEELLAQEVVSLIKSDAFMLDVKAKRDQLVSGSCALPSVVNLNAGLYTWSCGSMVIDPNTNKVTLAGNPYFGDNIFNGISGEIAISVSGETSNSVEASSASRVEQTTTTEKSKGTSLSKSKSSISGSGSTSTVSGGSTTAN